MRIHLIVIGTLKERYFSAAYEEYAKRLSRYADVRLTELKEERLPEKPGDAEIARALEREGEKILAKAKGVLYVFDSGGEMVTSPDFARLIGMHDDCGEEITFVIGSSHGLSERVKNAARGKISFGRITYPHQLMRVIVMEQIYRAFKIHKGESYHK